jgi:photosystem II stability/assembly factor-like uncharacterized protein
VAGSPSRPNEYYFGATGGGLWKTVDGGTTWFPVTDGQVTSSSVGAVAVAATNPDVVYIGMGETELRGSITQGDGVYKSTDGGTTWQHMGLAETQAIARIRIHPTNPDLVYVAALGHPYGPNPERGVFRSTDGGTIWQRILHHSDSAGAVDLIIDPTNPDILYAAMWQVYRKAWKMWGGGPYSGLFKSTDGGDSWTELTNNPGMPPRPIGKIGVAVSPAAPNRVWAMVESSEGGTFRSDDGGASWTRTNDERKLRQRNFYYTRIYADPQDPDVVYGLNTRLFKSTDGGETFELLDQQPPHGDQHDLWIDPTNPQRMINGNDGGGNVSINGGKTWTEQDYPTTQLYHVMATNDFPYHVCGAQQDNSTVCVPSDGWSNMQARGPNHGWYYAVGGGESGWISQHPTNHDLFYAGSQGALLTRYDRSNGQMQDIQVYPRFFSGEPASALPERWQWTFPIMFSPLDPTVMYTTSQHLWKTTNDGQSWERISPDLTLADPATLGPTGGLITMDMNGPEIYATIFALAPSVHDINTIWTGSDDGLMHLTRDGGATWANITPPDMPTYSRISIIDESRHAAGTAYVAANRYQVDDRAPYVWRTRDYGQTWTKIVTGIAPGHFARAVREDPVRPGLLFLATEHTAYVSFDAGDNWQPLTLNLPDTPIRDLVVKDHDVVLGTHGRSFWILDDIDPLREYTPTLAQKPLHVFQPREMYRLVSGGHFRITLEERAAFQYYLKDEVDTVTVEILDRSGEVIRTFEGTAPAAESATTPTTAAGLNRVEWDLTYPGATVFEGIIIWRGEPEVGPIAPPGNYQLRVTTAGATAMTPFEIRMDPRLKGVTEADLQEQFELSLNIRDKTSAANEAVIQIRDLRDQIKDRLDRSDDGGLQRTAQGFVEKITAVEEELYQVRNRSGQDPLNFPIKLNNRLATLRRIVENGQARPTDGAYKVFEELSAELEGHLGALNTALTEDLTRVNQRLGELGLVPIRVESVRMATQ